MRTTHPTSELRSEVKKSGLAPEYLDYLTKVAVKLYASFMGMRDFNENDPESKRILSQRVREAELAAKARSSGYRALGDETKSQHQTARTILTNLPSDAYREVLRGCDTLMKLSETCGYSKVKTNFLFSSGKPYKVNEDAGSVIDKRLKRIITDLVRESERPIAPPRRLAPLNIPLPLSSPIQTDLPSMPQGGAAVGNIEDESPKLYLPGEQKDSARTRIEARKGKVETPAIFRPVDSIVATETPVRRSTRVEKPSPAQQVPTETNFIPKLPTFTSPSELLTSPIQADLPSPLGGAAVENIEDESPELYLPSEQKDSARTRIEARRGTIVTPDIFRPVDSIVATETPVRRSTRVEKPRPTQQVPIEANFTPPSSSTPIPLPPVTKKITPPRPPITKKEQEAIKLRQSEKLSSRDRGDGDSDLHFMVRNELNYLLTETLERLESHSVGKVTDYIKTNLRNGSRETPLHLAITTGNLEITELLLKYKFKDSVNLVDDKKQSPLHIAVENGNIDLAHLLINNGARLLPTMAELNPSTPEMTEFVAKQDLILKSSNSAESAKEIREQMLKRLASRPPASLPTPATTEATKATVVKDSSLASKFMRAAENAFGVKLDKSKKSVKSSKPDKDGVFSMSNPLLLGVAPSPKKDDSSRSATIAASYLKPNASLRFISSAANLSGKTPGIGGIAA